jgi:hypothetical protein
MTKAELIEALSPFPDDIKIVVRDYDGDVCVEEVKLNSNSTHFIVNGNLLVEYDYYRDDKGYTDAIYIH